MMTQQHKSDDETMNIIADRIIMKQMEFITQKNNEANELTLVVCLVLALPITPRHLRNYDRVKLIEKIG